MKITFECPDKINGLLTMTVEPADYQEKVEKDTERLSQEGTGAGIPPRSGAHGND